MVDDAADSPGRLASAKQVLLVAVALPCTTALASVLSALLLESFVIRRPDGGSLTTHFPGFVYANATVMKVVLLETVVLLASGLALFLIGGAHHTSRRLRLSWPAVFAQPFALIVGTALLLGAQLVLPHTSPMDSSALSRLGVIVMLLLIAAGGVFAFAAAIRRESPFIIPLVGLLGNVGLVILFSLLKFYKLGFDQDAWAN